MNMLFNLGWSALIVFFVLSLIGIWIAYSFLNKFGLYLFCVIASIVCVMIPNAKLFSQTISISTVIMPVIFFAIVATFNKFGKSEAVKLFVITIITQAIAFIITLIQYAYIDAAIQTRAFMSWEMIGGCFANILSFVFACFFGMIFKEKVSLKKLNIAIQTACYIAFACVVENLVYTIVAYSGILSFGEILLTFIIKVLISLIVAVGLGYFERLLNRQLVFKVVKPESNLKEEKQTIKEKTDDTAQYTNKETEEKEIKEATEEEINYDNSAN